MYLYAIIGENSMEFQRPTFWLEASEYSKIYSEINQLYDSLYKGKSIALHYSYGMDGVAYVYWFEIRGFNDYNIFLKTFDNH